jgi:phage shock protein A
MITRIMNLFWGFLSIFISGIEKNNPEIVYDNAIEAVATAELELRRNTAAIVRQHNELKASKEETEQALKDVTKQLEAAASLPPEQVDMVAAGEMVNIQQQLIEKLNGLNQDYALAQADVEDATNALLEVQSERNKLKAEKNTNVARYNAANARLANIERQEGLSLNEVNKSLAGVRDNIKNTIAEAQLAKDMKGNSLESKVRQFQKVTGALSAQQTFKAMQEAAQNKTAGSRLLEQVIETKQLEAKK